VVAVDVADAIVVAVSIEDAGAAALASLVVFGV